MLNIIRKRALKQDTASTASTADTAAPIAQPAKMRRTMQLMSTHEALAVIESQENGVLPKARGTVSAAEARIVQPVIVVEKKKQPSAPAIEPAAQPELTAADKAIMRKQRDVNHQYGRRGEILFRWVLVGKIITQSCANTVLAQAAADMAKRGKH
jgi:hypothetical protein